MRPIELITQEARARRTVMIRARELNGSVEDREIEPYSLRRKKRGVLLYFFCLKRRGIRSLYVGNILAAQATGRSFVPRTRVEL
jgi:predicted DNA-binding transcriptional regulator YafY